jgi:hypothetical protein
MVKIRVYSLDALKNLIENADKIHGIHARVGVENFKMDAAFFACEYILTISVVAEKDGIVYVYKLDKQVSERQYLREEVNGELGKKERELAIKESKSVLAKLGIDEKDVIWDTEIE